MNHELNFNSDGRFQGWQDIRWELDNGRFQITESQYYTNGVFQFSTLSVWDRKQTEQNNFRSDDWGTPELARDAAEQCCMGWTNVVFEVEGFGSTVVKPMNEEAFV